MTDGVFVALIELIIQALVDIKARRVTVTIVSGFAYTHGLSVAVEVTQECC